MYLNLYVSTMTMTSLSFLFAFYLPSTAQMQDKPNDVITII